MSVAEFHERFLALERAANGVLAAVEGETAEVSFAFAASLITLRNEVRALDDLRARIEQAG